MKVVFAVLAVFLVSASAVEEKDVLQLWTKFQADFGKRYRSPLEARKRFAIFQDNLNTIEAHNKLFESGQSTYTMGINQFADWSRSEFLSFVNQGSANKTETLRSGREFVPSENFVEPDSVDWRNKGIVTPVKNQEDCVGDYAISAVGAMEGQHALKTGNLVSLSVQQVIDCSKNGGNDGCDGGLITSAFDYLRTNGIDSEADYPYENRDGDCRANNYESVTKLVDYVNIREGVESALVEAIATVGPVSVSVDANHNFQFYSGGIFNDHCNSYEPQHSALAVGFGKENRKQFYIIKNSWGESWGEEGYIRLSKYNRNLCGVATRSSYPVL